MGRAALGVAPLMVSPGCCAHCLDPRSDATALPAWTQGWAAAGDPLLPPPPPPPAGALTSATPTPTATAKPCPARTTPRHGRTAIQRSSSHSMDGMYSALWEPSQGLVQFSGVTYVDGQLATYYDSQTRRAQPRISWMKNVEKYYPQFWDINTWRFQSSEQRFRRDLVNLQKHYNQTRDPPMVKVTLMAGHDGLETLICQAYGFYPKEIDTTWRKDREVLEQQTFRRDVAPNSDRTYYAWLSIQIDPEDKDHYRCHVEHDGLLEPLDVAFREPGRKERLQEETLQQQQQHRLQ
ncbi:HLA class I histocompatibility antigen, B alpha chain-like [Rhineura floridana]|uniref:HLA class I histocompatibility antigen, B alpha chain-like n=1 Tax=Rhineura floridana TaxID=261503 RepID=UPI002AC867F2|nr:HLA class I histocompatibility antigen, B alpha chain-like [Rhineura floridana]